MLRRPLKTLRRATGRLCHLWVPLKRLRVLRSQRDARSQRWLLSTLRRFSGTHRWHNRAGSSPKGLQGSPKHTKGDSNRNLLEVRDSGSWSKLHMISHDARSQRWLLSTLRRLSGTHRWHNRPVARLRVFRGRLSIPKVIARWFSKSSWGAGLRLLKQIAHDFAWCQGSTLAS